MTACREIGNIVLRVQMPFLEDPELRLTFDRATRRFGLDARTCQAVFDALIDAGVIARTRDGAYVRQVQRPAQRDEGPAGDTVAGRAA